MKTKSVIETDPAKVRQACLNQPRVSHEEMVASILAQNGKLPSHKPEEGKHPIFPPAQPIVLSDSAKRPVTREEAAAQVKAGQEQMRRLLRGSAEPKDEVERAPEHESHNPD